MFFIALSFLTGCVLAYYSSHSSSIGLWWIGLGSVLIAVWRPRIGWQLIALWLGFAYASWQIQTLVDARWPDDLAGSDTIVLARIVGLPNHQGYRTRFNAELLEVSGKSVRSGSSRVRLSWYGKGRDLQAGDLWQLRLRLKPPRGLSNPGSFDYERWLFRQGIIATGYVRQSDDNLLRERPKWVPGKIRASLAQSVVPADRYDYAGVMRGLLIGDRSLIPDSRWQTLLKSGTNHLLAISGLHVGIAAAIGYYLTSGIWWLWPMLALRFPRQKAAALAALPPAILYGALAGFTVPTQRALLMLFVISLAVLFDRMRRRFSVLGVGLVVVLLWDSRAVLDAGFWLSFVAVFAIFASLNLSRNESRFSRLVRLQLMLSMGLAPLTLLFFAQASLVAPIANLIAVPYVSIFVVPLLFLATFISSFLPGLGSFLTGIVDLLLAGLFFILEWITSPSWSAIRYAVGEPWQLAALLLTGLSVLLPRGIPGRFLLLLMIIPLATAQGTKRGSGDFEVTFLDVGQGSAVVVETATHSLVYDTGPSYHGGRSAAETVVLPYLTWRGLRRVDRLVLSHMDNDHAGGADVLRERRLIELVMAPERLEVGPISKFQRCEAGLVWRWDGVTFAVLHPTPGKGSGTENDQSCVIHISSSAGSVLLAGDIESSAELSLIRQAGPILKADVLLAPHHGSATSSTRAFLEQVAPRWAVFSVGYKNRFGFPHAAVLERYEAMDIGLLRTDQSGAVRMTFSSGAEAPQVYQHRLASCHPWRIMGCDD